jgi:DNA repair exonuclease SbcCD ATPase subunit
MIIDKLEFKNINSYGNNTQVLEFGNDGGLILLCGPNGSGKSSIKQSLELCLFGKVQGKSGKRLALTKLPNRRNGSLYTGVFFKNQVMDDVVMKRFIQPNNFEMFVNEEPFTQRFKTMTEKEREKIIGYNFEVFKSFISLNMNDFKNFISLSKEDKENLLNKLFNLNELSVLYSIVKDLDNSNQTLINDLNDKIYENEQNILEYKQTIINIKNEQNFSKEERITEIKNDIFSKKPKFQELQDKIKNCDDDREKSNKKLAKLNILKSDKIKEKTRLEVEIEYIEEKIKLYNNGICPTCNTDLLSEHQHKNHLKSFETQLLQKSNLIIDCDKYLDRCILEDTKIRNNNDVLYNKKNTYQKELSDLKIELGTLNSEYKKLKEENNNISITSLDDKITKLKEENIKNEIILKELDNKSKNYDELKKMFSIDGIRKSMIKNALIPINEYLSDFIMKMESEYSAKLNDNFDASIMELNVLEIDPETLSKGEDKKINIAIALSYLKLVLKMKHSNIMFLDEIFDGVDVENINLTLKVLKEIALEHKINIIIVHHSMEQIVDSSIFDKIIKTKKDIFSDIEII